jgi:hypothetical protein
VELNDLARRIFLRHWWVLALGVIAGALLGAFFAGTSGRYMASARMVIDSPDPQAHTQAAAIADTARAIATSPTLLQKALTDAGVSKQSVTSFAANDVSVDSLGTSGVLSLSVTDSSRVVAATVANALANEVIQTRLDIANGLLNENRTKLAARIDALSNQITGYDGTIGRVNNSLAGSSGTERQVLSERLTNLSLQRDFLTQQRGILESELAGLLTTVSGRPAPTVISAASAANATPTGASYAPTAVVGALLGLIVAIAAAAAWEYARPSLVGGEAVARALTTPFLGTFSVSPEGELAGGSRYDVTYPLLEEARHAKVSTIDLLGAGAELDLATIARAIDTALASPGRPLAEASSGRQPRSASEFSVRPFQPRDLTEGRGSGLVVVAPYTLKQDELAGVTHFVRTTPWPLLGVMIYKPERHWWDVIFPKRSSDAERDEAAEGAQAKQNGTPEVISRR